MKDPFVFAEFRKSLGLTQEEFAEKCGTTIRSVQNWEQGKVITPQAMKLFQYIEREIISQKQSDASPLICGDGNATHSTKQVSLGDHSPNVNGDNNNVGDGEAFGKFIDELAAQRGLAERSLSLLESRDRQIDRMLDMMQQMINSK